MQNQKASVALIISTYNWPEALELVLKSVAQQTDMPDEIIIADDGSSQLTADVIEDCRTRYQLPVTHIWHEDKGFRKSRILNKAVKEVKSAYIIEIDGDIILDSNFVEDHRNAAKQGFFVQGSRAMLSEGKSKEILRTREITFSIFSKGLYSRFNALRLPFMKWLFIFDPSNPYHIKGCNLAFWKKDYIAVNGYFNNFEGWGGEDYEFGARLLHSGVQRRRLKMAALCYHIYHKINSRANSAQNDVIYKRTLADKSSWCNDGYAQV